MKVSDVVAIYLRQHDDTSVAQKTAFSRLAHRLTTYATLRCMLRWCCTLFTTTGNARSLDSCDPQAPFERNPKCALHTLFCVSVCLRSCSSDYPFRPPQLRVRPSPWTDSLVYFSSPGRMSFRQPPKNGMD